jgi:hypothetical protein
VTENLGIHVQPGRDEKNAFVQKVTSEATKENGVVSIYFVFLNTFVHRVISRIKNSNKWMQ